ncbi:hypothetical protein BDZ97DRAFT_2046387 [Flammula alnicola]|nr:hypothetical protein BDZ97DRAFT_2046387 [Flammula alnicola]
MEQENDNSPDVLAPEAKQKHIRITQQGKMKSWITLSLKFFEVCCLCRILTLHTLPALVDPDVHPCHLTDQQSIAQQTASIVTSVVPRLISVVEIIKREYIKNLETKRSSRTIGLHQYNELGTLEELGIVIDRTAGDGQEVIQDSAEAARSQDILQALGGKNHPRQTQTPFMRVTLSTVELPELLSKGASYQPPVRRKQSRTAKARAKKRAKAQTRIEKGPPLTLCR